MFFVNPPILFIVLIAMIKILVHLIRTQSSVLMVLLTTTLSHHHCKIVFLLMLTLLRCVIKSLLYVCPNWPCLPITTFFQNLVTKIIHKYGFCNRSWDGVRYMNDVRKPASRIWEGALILWQRVQVLLHAGNSSYSANFGCNSALSNIIEVLNPVFQP